MKVNCLQQSQFSGFLYLIVQQQVYFLLLLYLHGLLKMNFKLIEALALITLVKYGLWAVVMNILTYFETGSIGWMGWMLVASHFAMAVQAILYIPFYRFTWVHIVIAAIWTLHNDVIDYVFGQMPIYSKFKRICKCNWLFYILVIYCLY